MAVSKLGYQALSLAEGQAMKQRPGVAVRAGFPVCRSLSAVFNGRLSPCQAHAGLEVATGWVCPQIRSSSPRPGCWGQEGIFLIL